MADVLSITAAIFALIALGFAACRVGVLDRAANDVLGKFVINLALPALIFRALTSRDLGEIVDPGYLAAYLAGSLAALGVGYGWSRGAAGLGARTSVFHAMGMSCANSGFVGYPILAIAMPSVASSALALNMVVENLVMIPLVLILAERASAGAVTGRTLVRQIAIRLARNPILIAIVSGITVTLLPVALPTTLVRVVDTLASSAAAVALVSIGGGLALIPLAHTRSDVVPVVAGKLLLHPLLVAVAFAALSTAGLDVDRELASAGVLMAAMPAMGIYPVLAARHGEGGVAGIAMLAMTVASFPTISALLWVFQR